VRDVAHPDSAAQKADVLAVLDGMAEGADAALDAGWRARSLEVLNKADLLGGPEAVAARAEGGLAVSALTGEGLEALRAALDERLSAGMVVEAFSLPAEDGARLAWLYRHGEVLDRAEQAGRIHLTVRLSPADRARFGQLA
jgi:GTP-binding protein HflX